MTSDIFWMAVNIYHEARGEPTEGQKAVCKVVLNRHVKRRQTIKDVILWPNQFSWHNGGVFPPIKDYKALERCLSIAKDASLEWLNGDKLDSADHYHSDSIEKPWWAHKMTVVKKIGRHIFYQ
jgi:spore germination cell wall hydrolase CwlJ-like protein